VYNTPVCSSLPAGLCGQPEGGVALVSRRQEAGRQEPASPRRRCGVPGHAVGVRRFQDGWNCRRRIRTGGCGCRLSRFGVKEPADTSAAPSVPAFPVPASLVGKRRGVRWRQQGEHLVNPRMERVARGLQKSQAVEDRRHFPPSGRLYALMVAGRHRSGYESASVDVIRRDGRPQGAPARFNRER
jgi:hypothetical protein